MAAAAVSAAGISAFDIEDHESALMLCQDACSPSIRLRTGGGSPVVGADDIPPLQPAGSVSSLALAVGDVEVPKRFSWRSLANGRSAAGFVLVGAAVAAAIALTAFAPCVGDASPQTADPEAATALAAQPLVPGPFGEYAGPELAVRDFRLGAFPRYADPAAQLGSPPKPYEPPSKGCHGWCQGGTCCNDGKLCCGSDAVCCGTSCCSGGSICCDKHIGLCCSEDSMCCWGKLCCAPSWTCGNTRRYGNGLKFKLLESCGGGAQFRRLLDEQRYKQQFRALIAENSTALRQLVEGGGTAQQDRN